MKPSLKLLLYLFFASLHFQVFSQSARPINRNIDSLISLIPKQKDSALVKTYDQLFKAYIQKEPKKARPYLDSAQAVAKNLDDKKLKAMLLQDEGDYYQHISEFAKASAYYKRAISRYTELDDQRQLASSHNALGITQKNLGQMGAALESYLKRIKIIEALGSPEEDMAPALMNIGKLYSKLGNLAVSNDYYKRVEEICVKHDLKYGLAITRSNRATNLVQTQQYEEALSLYFGAIPYFEENNRQLELGEQYNLIGSAYIQMDSLKTAKEYLDKALKLSKANGEMSIVGLATRNLGDVYFKEKKYNAALQQFRRSLDISKQTSHNIEIVDDYLKISNTYEKLGNVAKAYEFQKIYAAAHDSIFSQENSQKISALELRYKTEKSEQEILLQKQEIALLEEKEKASNLQRILLITGLLASLLFFGLGYYAIRQKMKRNKLERDRVRAELAFKKKELTTHALHLAKKNEVLEGLKQKAAELKASAGGGRAYQQIIQTINFDQQDDKVWENFTQYFEAVHKDFAGDATRKYPDISRTELRLMALIKMNLSSKEIANILNISSDGVKKARQRLRKKMNLSSEDSLETNILSI
ncbi:MAG: tetratricopeptide repeat protein [Aurantibacter sp.]